MARQLKAGCAVAPALLRLEYTNVLRTACNAPTAQDMLTLLGRLPIDFAPETPEPAQILDLALRRQLPIATKDEALARAAPVAGVGVVRADA